MVVKVGAPAPPFDAPSSTGGRVRLSDFAGRWLVLFFFPKAGTPGCSLQARRFAENLPEFGRLGAAVLGVSTDPPERQQAFGARVGEDCGQEIALLADPGRELCRTYGVLSGLGGLLGLSARHTFVVAPDGTVAAEWAANPLHDAAVALATLERLQARA